MLTLLAGLVSLLGLTAVALVPSGAWAKPGAGQACVASAEKVVAWDAEADLYVVASYLERAHPPASGAQVFPNLIELRRLSTGAQIDLVNCATRPGDLRATSATAPCDFRALFGARIPARAKFRRQGPGVARNRLAIKAFAEGSDRAFALVAKASGASAWHRVMWLGDEVPQGSDRVNIRIVDSEVWQGDVLVGLEISHRGGTCASTDARMVRLRQIDLDQPAALEHQTHLLARLKEASPFAAWRTAAEIAPLPPQRLLNAMVAAADAGKHDFAARWWTATTTGLPLDQVATLAGLMRDRPELRETSRLIRLPTFPEDASPKALPPQLPPQDGPSPRPRGEDR